MFSPLCGEWTSFKRGYVSPLTWHISFSLISFFWNHLLPFPTSHFLLQTHWITFGSLCAAGNLCLCCFPCPEALFLGIAPSFPWLTPGYSSGFSFSITSPRKVFLTPYLIPHCSLNISFPYWCSQCIEIISLYSLPSWLNCIFLPRGQRLSHAMSFTSTVARDV